jgi:tartrate-resistant acid phosphatase type 5
MRLTKAIQFMFVLLTISLSVSIARAQDKPELRLFALGDWGLNSPHRQAVGNAMAERATTVKPDAALLLGDNFYVKLTGIDDPQIQSFFERTYDKKKLDIPFYAIFGNHDYREHNDGIELAYAARGDTRMKIPSRWYRLDLPQDKPIATIFMLDSDQPVLAAGQWDEQLKWLAAELAKPHAPWLICAAHHDIFGNGNHGDNGVLMTSWGPLFKQYHVDFYLCGHEHTLQHLEIDGWPMSFVIAGGGGAGTKPMLRDNRGPFSRAVTGFADLAFTPDLATVRLVDETGKTLHAFTRDRDGKVTVTDNTPSDKATTQPLRVIQGIDGKKGEQKKPDTWGF